MTNLLPNLMHTYQKLPLSFTYGNGVWLFDADGNKYLDALSGIAVTILGHNYLPVTQALQTQCAKLIHASNLFTIKEQIELADILQNIVGRPMKAFFSNSGTEAIECAIKLARLIGTNRGIKEPKIIVMHNAFHGRTFGSLSASDSEKAKTGFAPFVPGFIVANYNDVDAIQALRSNHDIVAVLVEPIQGEAGIRMPNPNYLTELRRICDAENWLLIIDEIQSGMGRTGKFFAYSHHNIIPDVITLAKGLANGVPIGATLVKAELDPFTPGKHGSTFGGNPLACSAAIATCKAILENHLIANAANQGEKILAGLKHELANTADIIAIRGQGLMLGIELAYPCREILSLAIKHGILFNIAREKVIRILPPLIINNAHADEIITRVSTVIKTFVHNKKYIQMNN